MPSAPALPLVDAPGEAAPLTEAQAGLWYAQRLDPDNPVFNTAHALELRGALDVEAFRAAVDAAVAEADALAIRVREDDARGGPVQWVDPSARPALQIVDLRDQVDPAEEAKRRIRTDLETPLDLERDPLAVELLFVLGEQRFVWYQRVHHLATDAYGTTLLLRRVCDLYAAAVADSDSPPSPFAPYGALLHWEAEYTASEKRERDREYWIEEFADAPPPASLAPGAQRSAHRYRSRSADLDPAFLERLIARSAQAGVTWPDALVSLVAAYLQRHTGEDAVTLGIPVMNRLGGVASRVPALTMNVLPLRVPIDEEAPLVEIWLAAAKLMAKGRRHGRYRGEQLRRDLGLLGEDQRLHGPLVNIIPLEEPLHLPGLEVVHRVLATGPVDDLNIEFRGAAGGRSMRLEIQAHPGRYSEEVVAAHLERLRTFLANAVDAERLVEVPTLTPAEQRRWVEEVNCTEHAVDRRTLAQLLEDRLAERPQAEALTFQGASLTAGELDEVTATLACELVERGVGPGSVVGVLLPRSLELVVALLAIVRAGGAYLPLDPEHPPERIARTLEQAEAFVVIHPTGHPERSSGLPAADTATRHPERSSGEAGAESKDLLRTNGRSFAAPPSAAPLRMTDETYGEANPRAESARSFATPPPAAPLRMTSGSVRPQAGAPLRMTGAPSGQPGPPSRIDTLHLNLPELRSRPAAAARERLRARGTAPAPHDPAYVIYTSGSTGDPKGVVVEHRSIVNRLEWMRMEYGVGPGDRIIQKTPATFDVSVWEFFLPFLSGATLVVAPPGVHRDPLALATLMREERITIAHFVPSMLTLFLEEPSVREGLSLSRVFCSGEALPAPLRDRFHQQIDAELHNLYGPTEAAVDVSYWAAGPEDRSDPVPIGRPVWNTQLYVLDERMRPLPPGVTGELYIGGVQVARGYLHRPDLTAERFIPDPFGGPDDRLYRTGDLAAWRPDGVIEFYGRSDFQVKIRGQRVEPGEIEAALLAHEAIAHAVVTAREDRPGDQRLVAYIVAAEAVVPPSPEALHEHLRRWLPDGWIPSAFVVLDALPLTSSGKLDRAALPAPSTRGIADGTSAGRPPEGETEERLAALFAELLGVETVLADDDFFRLGGHSLTAARLAARIREGWGREIGLAAVFAHPTVARLRQQLDAIGEDGRQGVEAEGLGPLIRIGDGDGPAPPLFLVHPAGGISWCYRTLAEHLSPGRRVYGLQARGLDPDAPLPATLDEMAADYVAQIRQVHSEGPVHLGGWSVGGIIAHAMAVQLERAGVEVGVLAMLDAYPSNRWRGLPDADDRAALKALLQIAGRDPERVPEALLTRERVIAMLREGDHPLGRLSERALEGVARVVDRNNRLVRAHYHQPFGGGLLHFRAALDHADEDLHPEQWAPYVGSLQVHDVESLHPHMINAEPSAEVARVLERQLDRHLARRGS